METIISYTIGQKIMKAYWENATGCLKSIMFPNMVKIFKEVYSSLIICLNYKAYYISQKNMAFYYIIQIRRRHNRFKTITTISLHIPSRKFLMTPI